MPGEFFFLTFGGLGISLAGFAGLIFLLDMSGTDDNPISRWRIRHIALTGLMIATGGLLVFPAFFLTGDIATTVRLIAAFGVLSLALSARRDLKPGPAWPDERRRRLNFVLVGLTMGVWLIALATAEVGWLMLSFVLWISAPIGTFANSILDLRVEDAPPGST